MLRTSTFPIPPREESALGAKNRFKLWRCYILGVKPRGVPRRRDKAVVLGQTDRLFAGQQFVQTGPDGPHKGATPSARSNKRRRPPRVRTPPTLSTVLRRRVISKPAPSALAGVSFRPERGRWSAHGLTGGRSADRGAARHDDGIGWLFVAPDILWQGIPITIQSGVTATARRVSSATGEAADTRRQRLGEENRAC